jgi:NTE family protein
MTEHYIDTLVLSGGGIKGFAYCGVFKYFEEQKYIDIKIKNVSAVSIGSVFALLYIIGYTSQELETEILNKRINELSNLKIENFVNKFGLESGKGITTWIETLLLKKGLKQNITLKELYCEFGVHFKIYATNISIYKYTYFDHIITPDMSVVKAIRMAISVPFFFTMQKHNEHVYVDGALINNYPIEQSIQKDKDDNSHIIGVLLLDNNNNNQNSNQINNIDEYICHILKCFIIQSEIYNNYQSTPIKEQTINVYTNSLSKSPISFNINIKDKKQFILDGYNATKTYFEKRFIQS